jgi:hypothetical protein
VFGINIGNPYARSQALFESPFPESEKATKILNNHRLETLSLAAQEEILSHDLM